MLNKTVLQNLYIDQSKTQHEIAKICGVGRDTIINWMRKYNIPGRSCGPLSQPLRERIKTKIDIDINTGCWNWRGNLNNKGYGYLNSHGKHYLAHRISYELFVGEIPEGLTIDHLCRNRRCVNPSHLEPVTLRENILRGENFTAYQARQTHCKRGHPLFGSNLYISLQGNRRCRTCDKMHQRLRCRRVNYLRRIL
jgi:hypothetical protein